MAGIRISRRVYYDDTDSGGVVYHTHYLRYMEHARTDFLHRRGIGPPLLEREHGIIFVVAGLSIRYRAPSRLGDILQIGADVLETGRTTVFFDQRVWLQDGDGGQLLHELAAARVDVVCVNTKSFKPARIPPPVRERIIRDH